jgi:hypothetical protein
MAWLLALTEAPEATMEQLPLLRSLIQRKPDDGRLDRDVVCTFCGKRIAATQEQYRIQGEPFHDSCWDQMQKRP